MPSVEAKLILGSGSPRRKELMEKLGVPFSVEVSDIDETLPENIKVEDAAEYLSGIKAADVFEKHAKEAVTVIGSDTIVLEKGRIFGKPHSAGEAYEMLRALSGKIHEVRTGVTIISNAVNAETVRISGADLNGAGAADEKGKGLEPCGTDRILRTSFTGVTSVEFYELSDEEIYEYIKTGEPFDKAGAYGVQGAGALLVKAIHGDFYTVMGFPIARVYRELKSRGCI